MALFQSDFDQDEFSDITIVSGGRKFKCHKVILSKIEYFRNLVKKSSGFKESHEREIVLQEDTPEVVEAVLRSLYSFDYKEIAAMRPVPATPSYHLDVYKAAHKYQMEGLMTKVLSSLETLLQATKTNVPIAEGGTDAGDVFASIKLLLDHRDYSDCFVDMAHNMIEHHLSALMGLRGFRRWIDEDDNEPALEILKTVLAGRSSHVVQVCSECECTILDNYDGQHFCIAYPQHVQNTATCIAKMFGPGQRKLNGQQGPHTTYFQQPPPETAKARRKFLRPLLLYTSCFALGAYGHSWLHEFVELAEMEELAENDRFVSGSFAPWRAIQSLEGNSQARNVPIMDLKHAQAYLEACSSYSITPKAVGHSCQLASNSPCEDDLSHGILAARRDPHRDWAEWSIYDGHAGPRTAALLAEVLAPAVGGHLSDEKCIGRAYVPDDFVIVRTIQKAFLAIDDLICKNMASRAIQRGDDDLAYAYSQLSASVSGSCALMALFDPEHGVLRVANTGDSRAVLGRWDHQEGRYVAKAMSADQTGFNQSEVKRLQEEHPGEEVVDSKTGRVHGLAVSRAFGDTRWKWTEHTSRMVYEKCWGPAPRPNGVIKTPPYLTAEPEIMETRVQDGEHPDFLILASDGLWDNVTSEDAVICVQQWLDKNEPTRFLTAERPSLTEERENTPQISTLDTYKPDFVNDPAVDNDTYWDESERAMKWRVSPKHFVVEDENCGVHLIKNALGGRRRNLFRGLMSVQPPNSRKVRDDITVQVVFFGVNVDIEALQTRERIA